MGTPLGLLGTILCATGASPDSNKTLLISAHGAKSNGKFDKPFGTAIAFCTPSSMALSADLGAAIQGNVHPSENPHTTTNMDDYNLTYFQSDPAFNVIKGMLSGTNFQVLVINPSVNATLSGVLTALDNLNLKYASIWCLFCRVTNLSNQWSGNSYVGPNYQGTTHQTYLTNTQLASNAFKIGQAIQQQVNSGALTKK
jgi:hypothetical protein